MAFAHQPCHLFHNTQRNGRMAGRKSSQVELIVSLSGVYEGLRAGRNTFSARSPPRGLPFGDMTQIHDLTVTGLAAAIHERQLSPVDVANHYLRRTEELNAQVGAFYTVTAELALEQARAAEKTVTERSGSAPLPPLLGVPIPIKDLNSVAGVRQTFG